MLSMTTCVRGGGMHPLIGPFSSGVMVVWMVNINNELLAFFLYF
jgi:hypothetical protein